MVTLTVETVKTKLPSPQMVTLTVETVKPEPPEAENGDPQSKQ